MGKGSINNISTKQKLNTKSSTEAELMGVDDISMYVIWTKHFIEAQGYKTKEKHYLPRQPKHNFVRKE